MTLRAYRLALTLPLLALLLLAQQGATLHGLSHIYYSGQALGAELSAGGHLLNDDSCLTCQAFAQIAHPATSPSHGFVAPAAAPPQSLDPEYSLLSASAPTPRNRGPPQAAA